MLRLTPEQMVNAFGSAGTQSAGFWEFLRDAAHSNRITDEFRFVGMENCTKAANLAVTILHSRDRAKATKHKQHSYPCCYADRPGTREHGARRYARVRAGEDPRS